MFRVSETGGPYALASMIFMFFFWPNVLHHASATFLFINAILFGTTIWRLSSRELTYFSGLSSVGNRLESGCINLSIFYAIPILMLLCTFSVGIMLIGLLKGKRWSEERWIMVISPLGGPPPVVGKIIDVSSDGDTFGKAALRGAKGIAAAILIIAGVCLAIALIIWAMITFLH